MPFFSVVVPLFNKEKFIGNTINSILSQTFTDFELIIVDDVSTDNSLEIAKSINDERISIISHSQNRGLSATRNTGIRAASADFVAFIDADDLWKPDFLETISILIGRFPQAGIFATGYDEKYNYGIAAAIRKNLEFKPGEMNIIPDFFDANSAQPVFCYSSVAVKKSVFDDTGYFDEAITLGEDVDFNIRAGMKYPVAYCNKSCATYIIFSENQITNSEAKGKVATDFSKYQAEADANPSLKKYLDVNRYILAMRYKMSGDDESFKALKSQIDIVNLTSMQKMLLLSPAWTVEILRKVKSVFLRQGVRLTTFR